MRDDILAKPTPHKGIIPIFSTTTPLPLHVRKPVMFPSCPHRLRLLHAHIRGGHANLLVPDSPPPPTPPTALLLLPGCTASPLPRDLRSPPRLLTRFAGGYRPLRDELLRSGRRSTHLFVMFPGLQPVRCKLSDSSVVVGRVLILPADQGSKPGICTKKNLSLTLCSKHI